MRLPKYLIEITRKIKQDNSIPLDQACEVQSWNAVEARSVVHVNNTAGIIMHFLSDCLLMHLLG